VPSTFNAATVSDLIADINAANQAGRSNTITLTAPAASPYVLTAVDNTTNGANGLPVIAKNDALTIVGSVDTIERSTALGTPYFRIFDVAKGGSLILENLTLQSGLAYGAGASAEGGAIYNQGALDLNGVTVQNNIAQGQDGAGNSAAGGGVYSGGSLTMEGGTTIANNQAIGGHGSQGNWIRGIRGSYLGPGGRGGDGAGGGLCVVAGRAAIIDACFSSNSATGGVGGFGGTCGSGGNGLGGGMEVSGGAVSLTNDTFSSNNARGGQGGSGSSSPTVPAQFPGPGGNGFGAGVYVDGATLTLRDDSVTTNAASGGAGGHSGPGSWVGAVGLGEGGGIYIETAATVYLDAFTVANVLYNKASTSDPDIHGSYSSIP
jgi:hypothetical protein